MSAVGHWVGFPAVACLQLGPLHARSGLPHMDVHGFGDMRWIYPGVRFRAYSRQKKMAWSVPCPQQGSAGLSKDFLAHPGGGESHYAARR